MKAIIASDIHGNLEYTKKLYELCEKIDPDQIILLGDLLNNYYLNDYFEVNEIVTLLNRWSVRTIGVRGNTDRDNDLERLLFPIYDTYTEIDLDNNHFYLTHGHLNDKYDYLFDDNYCLMGHTHRYNLEGKHLNPGSVGIPRGNKEHTCLIYENNLFKLINLEDFTIIAEKSIK